MGADGSHPIPSDPPNSSAWADLFIIGAGPAGLTAAVEAVRLGSRVVVVEKGAIVGGIARTESYKGFLFDMGGHRFFTKVGWIDAWWREHLGEAFIRRPRLSRILYRGKYFAYPPNFRDAMGKLGPVEAVRIGLSYLRAQVFPARTVVSFEHWVSNNFGARLFGIFFKSYTEKVWGISCKALRAEWAAQRIKNMSLRTLLSSMFSRSGSNVTSLIEAFDYPREGPGMMWRAAADRVVKDGGDLRLKTELLQLQHSGSRIHRAVVREGGETRVCPADAFISSMPLPDLLGKLDPPPPPAVREASDQLKFRGFLTVCAIVDAPDLFPDNWIYIHEPQVKVARIQNFKNWSPDMTPDPSKTSLGLEYFCDEGDATWLTPDSDLIALAARELAAIGLISDPSQVIDGCVFRVPNAYPIYDQDYAEALEVIRAYLDGFDNLRTIGRNGLHRYNNQDHSMVAGRMAARQLLLGEPGDLWSINTEGEYHETVGSQPAPRGAARPQLAEAGAVP
ncbi:NAD(P)/FAD-dependent oxidoreductase [Phenylobacterium sp.]|uniref:NAD(P)/FAD-dependent oxidoreductase n=1 Tax=Phenylobacterium sp. TaxID=1871053 RepID=UPI00356A265A